MDKYDWAWWAGCVMIGLLLLVCWVVLAPLALIWALNTLFHFGIEMTLGTWCAMFLILSLVGGIGLKLRR